MKSLYGHLGTPFIQLENYELDEEITDLIPKPISQEYKVIALEKLRGIVSIGMVNPKDEVAQSITKKTLNALILPIQIAEEAFTKVINERK